MSLNAGTKSQVKKQDTSYSKQNQSRGNRKWATNNNNNTTNGGNGRGGNYSTTATINTNPSGQQQSNNQGTSVVEDPDLIYHMHDRMLFLLGNLYGSKVQVTVRNGIKYEGLFQGATTEGDLGLSLTFARKIYDPAADKTKSSLQQPVLSCLLIFSKDLLEITALDTDLTAGELLIQEKDSFKTDTDISGKGEIKERELHKWNPELPEGSVMESLEDGSLESGLGVGGNTSGSWNQFEANEKLFGVTTDFNEELYTTRLDRSAPDYKDREKWAIEKANEIQRSATNNPHMLEERNLATADDSGMDEEDRYGAVVRDAGKDKENVYVPPALRNKQSHTPKPQEQPAHFANFSPDSPLHKLTTGTLTTAPPSHLEPNKLKKTINEKQTPKRIETEIATTFRQFAIKEKDKLQAKRQALHKKEIDDRLASLVKFHKSFKLEVPIPPDMLPLLNKGKKSPASGTQSSTKSSPSTSPDSQQEASTIKPADTTDNTKKTGFKFNIKASEFKPNPTASAFVPGGMKIGTTLDDPAFAGRSLKKGSLNDPVTINTIFKAPFTKDKYKKPSTIGPTWPYGSKQYRHQFNQYNPYSEDIFTGYPTPAYGYGYPQYRYHQQYVPGMSAMPVQQQNVSYMSPQFAPNVPITAAPMHPGAAYSPQMPNVSPHGSPFPQDYSSPQRSPMPPPNGGPPPQVYQYQGNPSPGGTMPPVRYAPDMMTPPSGTPVMMPQRPVMPGEHPSPGAVHYPPPMNRPPHEQSSPSSQSDSLAEP